MQIVKTIKEVRDTVSNWKKKGLSIGFVPTMGYLHEGHRSLMDKARAENDKVVVSIFVNPIQFGPKEDLSTYPRDLEKDSLLCADAGVDLIFHPEVQEMYPYGNPFTYVDVKELTTGLCGAKRPGHFVGVCTVVSKLFNIVAPNNAYFGQKDAQQVAVIKKMVQDLNFNVEIISCPIIREEDGLAKSSRNTYLSEVERIAALVLSRSLNKAKEALDNEETSANSIKELITKELNSEALAKIDYIEVVCGDTLAPIENIKPNTLIALAVFIGKTRLIDNLSYIKGE